jgi:hypothetical protein
MQKNCIIVSPYFPPSTLAGVHRARHLVKHLPAAGWHPILVCVDEAYHEEKLDPALAQLVPASAELVKVKAVSPRYTRPLGLGEISLRGFRSLRKAVFDLLETREISAVLITGSPYYPMLLASTIRKRYGVPVVLDFQDPWLSATGAQQPLLSKAGISHALAIALQPRALRGASFVTAVSDIQNEELHRLYPWLDATKMAAVPVGSDKEEFGHLAVAPAESAALDWNTGGFNVCYAGTIWPTVLPTLRVFLRAVARLREAFPDTGQRLCLHFVGTTAHPDNTWEYRVLPMAAEEGVGDLVREVPQRLPYLQALSILSNATGNIMLGSNEPHYTASKVFPYLMSGRPYISLFHAASTAHTILSAAGGGVTFSFTSQEDLERQLDDIARGLKRLVDGETEKPLDEAVYEGYEAASIARRFADIFENVSS